MKQFFQALFIITTLAFGSMVGATTSFSDNGGDHLTLKVIGARAQATVSVSGLIASTAQIKIFFNTDIQKENCSGTPVATINGSKISFNQKYATVNMGGALYYASVCLYNITDYGTFLVRELSDYDYVGGID